MVFDTDNTLRNIVLLVAIIVIAVFAIIIIPPYLNPPTQSGVPELSYNIISGSGKASAQGSIELEITNTGDKASGVTVFLSSDSFDDVSKYVGDVSEGSPKTETLNVAVNDVDNDEYSVRVQYSCDQLNGDAELISGSFVVIPDVSLVEVNFEKNIFGQDIDTIEQQGQAKLRFKIKNNSDKSTYRNMHAILEVNGDNHNFIINPVQHSIESIGPNGKTDDPPYEFIIEGNLTPVGTYHLTVVLYYNECEVTSHQRTFYVK